MKLLESIIIINKAMKTLEVKYNHLNLNNVLM